MCFGSKSLYTLIFGVQVALRLKKEKKRRWAPSPNMILSHTHTQTRAHTQAPIFPLACRFGASGPAGAEHGGRRRRQGRKAHQRVLGACSTALDWFCPELFFLGGPNVLPKLGCFLLPLAKCARAKVWAVLAAETAKKGLKGIGSRSEVSRERSSLKKFRIYRGPLQFSRAKRSKGQKTGSVEVQGPNSSIA